MRGILTGAGFRIPCQGASSVPSLRTTDGGGLALLWREADEGR